MLTNYFSVWLTMQEILHKNRCIIDSIDQLNPHFYFQRDILKIERENKGGTMTHLALDKVVSDDLKTMRADAMKVVIVVTDGESTKPELTKKSAALLKSVCFVLNFHLSEV